MGACVEITHWSYKYPLNENWAVHDLSLKVDSGERLLLSGRSGWGKSTLLQGIAGILGDAEDGGFMQGSITIDGKPALDARGKIGLILQDPESQVIFARVVDNATFGAENLGVERSKILTRTNHALKTVHLDETYGISPDRLAQRLSGGQTQRLSIASIMAMQPDVIVCDEPTANLNPDGVVDVVSAISEAAEQTHATLIVVDHNISAWEGVIDRRVELGEPIHLEHFAGQFAPHQKTSSLDVAMSATQLCSGYEDVQVSSSFSHDFYTGTITALTGVNGAGKTTLALTLAGILPALSGEVNVGESVRAELSKTQPSQWESGELASRIQYVFQNPEHQFVSHTVREEMVSALRISHQHATEEELNILAKQRLTYYELNQQIEQNPYSLSGGQKRRLTVACAIEAQPKILIVDEPTYGQDPATWLTLVSMFAKLRDKGTCIITVTHDRQFIDALGAEEVVIEPNPLQKSAHDVRSESQSEVVAKLNPLTRLFTGLLVGLPLITSLDIVSSSVALLAELVVALCIGFTVRTIATYSWPILIGAVGSFMTVIIYNGQHDAVLAAATAIRVLAMGIPAVVLVMRMDPTDLADAFVQKLHLSDRFVYAALAGFRLLPLLKVDMESIHHARRIRGIDSQTFWKKWKNDALDILILAIRRSTTLSVVMQARGFGAPYERTRMRQSLMHKSDGYAFIISLVIPFVALTVAYYGGALNLFGNLI